jgi:phage shock protein A
MTDDDWSYLTNLPYHELCAIDDDWRRRHQHLLRQREQRQQKPEQAMQRPTDAEIEGLRRFVMAHTDTGIEGLRRFVLDHVGALAEEAGAMTGTLEKQQRLLQQDIERLTTEVAVLRAEIERLRARDEERRTEAAMVRGIAEGKIIAALPKPDSKSNGHIN